MSRPKFNWEDYKWIQKTEQAKKIEEKICKKLDWKASTMKHVVKRIKKVLPKAYIFYQEDEYYLYEDYAKTFLKTCPLDLGLKNNGIDVSNCLTKVYISSENLDTN